MIFPKEIDNYVISTLIDNTSLTFSELEKKLKWKVSKPNLYKKINTLIDKHILVKEHKKISLNKKRIMSYLTLAKKIQNNFLWDEHININLKDWEHQKFTASSLIELDSIRSSLLSQLNLMYNYNYPNYIYNSHTYHILWMPEADTQLFENIWKNNLKTFFLAWNKTPLDMFWIQIINKIHNTSALASDTTDLLKKWYFLNIVWEYYIEVLLPDALNSYFEIFFQNTHAFHDLNIELFKQLFHMKVPLHCTLHKSQVQASAFKKIIEKEFSKDKWEKTK